MRNLTPNEVERLEQQGCLCDDWKKIRVDEHFAADKIRNAAFEGVVYIGRNTTIRNVRVKIANYRIGDNVTIIDCGSIVADEDSSFGVGHEVSVVNEAGGREVKLSADLTSNIAYIVAMHRYNQQMVAAYDRLVDMEAKRVRGRAEIADGVSIIGCQTINNVRIANSAQLNGCACLENGTILSCKAQPTIVGANVIARDFIIAEGAAVTDAANIRSTYVGQCSQVGSGFFAENSLVFCNCQLFNGEAVSAFCGPFTVSHHKTSLLIAAIYSFFNAGSATNASNHHYRLGPSHQAVYDRGVKTGSGSYVLEPAHIGAYTMVVGQHKGNPDTTLFPFSYLIDKQGESYIMPAQNLRTIGLYRDEYKWLRRDGRIDEIARDQYTVETLNPLTVSMLIRAVKGADQLIAKAQGDTILHNGCRIAKGLLQRARTAYNEVAQTYVLDHYLDSQDEDGAPNTWVDCGGLVVPKDQLDVIESNLVDGMYSSVGDLAKAFKTMANYYRHEESTWCAMIAKDVFNASSEPDEDDLAKVVGGYTNLMNAMVADAQKDFSKKLATGYGLDDEQQAQHEYAIIKGTTDTNKAVAQCKSHYEQKIRDAKRKWH